jgi:WD40 repeat protein
MNPRFLALGLAAAFALAAWAQQPKTDIPAINVNNAKLVVASPEVGSPLTSVVFNEEKGLLIAGAEDGSLRLWKAEEGKEVIDKDAKGQIIKAHDKVVTSLATGGSTLASASTDGKILLWGLPPDKPTQTIKPAATVRALAVSTDGKLLACGGDDNAVQLYDPASAKPTVKLTGPTDWIMAVAISPDGKTVIAGGHDGKLWAWGVDGQKRFDVLAQAPVPPKAPAPATNVVSALAFSPDGKQIALGGSDGKVYLFQAADGKFIRQMQGHTGGVTGLVYHPAGAVLLSSSKDRSVRLWNPNGGNVLKTLDGHTAWVEGITLLRKGTKLVSASADQTVRLWDLGAVPPKPMPKKK